MSGNNGKCFLDLRVSNSISKERHNPENFDENFSKLTIFEELILQHSKISWKIMSRNNGNFYLELRVSNSIF